MVFETARCLVRHFTIADEAECFLLNGDIEVVRYIRPVKSAEECSAFLQQIISDQELAPLYGRWYVANKITREFIGSFAVIPITGTDKIQLGYSLLPQQWGKGYATELTFGGLQYVFTQTNLQTIYAVTEVANTDSQKVLLKTGFTLFNSYTENGKDLLEFSYAKEKFLQLFQ